MKISVGTFSLLLTLLLFSCNSSNKKDHIEVSEVSIIDSVPDMTHELTAVVKDSMVKRLQGKWKEPQYPFRLVHFKDTTVKFTEEGLVEAPTFKLYNLAPTCPFEVNNIMNAGNNEIYLVIFETRRCEILHIYDDSLTLSGFNVSANSAYKIVYKKLD